MKQALHFSALAALLLTFGSNNVCHAGNSRLKTPYARQDPLAVRQVQLLSSGPVRGELVEFTVSVSATYDNPFDPDDVMVDAQITGPSGKMLVVPAFFHRDFRRESRNGREALTPMATPDGAYDSPRSKPVNIG